MAFLPVEIEIIDAVYRAVSTAYQNTTQSEPQLVANLVWYLPNFINQIKFKGASSVRAGGVFVHAQPFVTCVSFPEIKPKSVEIGDLLLVRTLVENNVVVEQRALLLQAKKVKHSLAIPDNQNQWHLYEQWPAFTYASRSGELTGKQRHIKEPDMYEAAKYLLIGRDSAASGCDFICCIDWPSHWCSRLLNNCHHYTAQPTRPEISRYRCFADELIEFLTGNAGKVFVKPKLRTRGWDRVIHDLIDETVKAKKTIYTGRAVGQSTTAKRGYGTFFCSLADQSSFSLFRGDSDGEASNFDEPPNVPGEWSGDSDGDGGGISVIEFVVNHGEG